jgi:membrane associated rhomboid family serine protease
MFFLIPIRSEKDTNKIPNLTIALIALNLVIWIFTSRIVSSEFKQIGEIHEQLMMIEAEYIQTAQRKYPDLFKNRDSLEIHKAFFEKNIIPQNSHIYKEWLSLYNKLQSLVNNTFFHRWGFIPARLNFLKLLISMFLHADIFHVFGNMLFLWIVGCNMEDDWGWPRFLGLYLLSGIAAELLHAILTPNMIIPCIGASGAVAGIMGAFLIQHFKTKIRFFYFILLYIRPICGTVKIWAGIVLPFWFLLELKNANSGLQSGTAHWAHVGGFIFGAVAVTLTKYLSPSKPAVVEEAEDDTLIYRLSEAIRHDPENYKAQVELARIIHKNGHSGDAAISYGLALDTVFNLGEREIALGIYEEIKQYNLLERLPDYNLFKIAGMLKEAGKFKEAVTTYGSYIKWYPQGSMRANAVYHAYLILKNSLNNEKLAGNALTFLKREYPDFSLPA